jgi:hypothetical protein
MKTITPKGAATAAARLTDAQRGADPCSMRVAKAKKSAPHTSGLYAASAAGLPLAGRGRPRGAAKARPRHADQRLAPRAGDQGFAPHASRGSHFGQPWLNLARHASGDQSAYVHTVYDISQCSPAPAAPWYLGTVMMRRNRQSDWADTDAQARDDHPRGGVGGAAGAPCILSTQTKSA